MDKRKGNPIGWCDTTWNPIVGCSKISPGCAHCYAETMAVRLAAMGQEKYQAVTAKNPEACLVGGEPYISYSGWNGNVNFGTRSELEKPFHWKSHRWIFISSMGDLFHKVVPFEWIDKILTVVACCYWHTFMILTKRPERMLDYFRSIENGRLVENLVNRPLGKLETESFAISESESAPFRTFYGRKWPLSNLTLGVTAENQEMADLRIPILLDTPAAYRFVSIEPMLGPINLTMIKWHKMLINQGDYKQYGLPTPKEVWSCNNVLVSRKADSIGNIEKIGLDWVILGGENGHGARPMDPEWPRKVRDDCKAAGVPFFFKGWGSWRPWCENCEGTGFYGDNGPGIKGNEEYQVCDYPHTEMRKLKGKNDYLDGVQHHEFPEVKK